MSHHRASLPSLLLQIVAIGMAGLLATPSFGQTAGPPSKGQLPSYRTGLQVDPPESPTRSDSAELLGRARRRGSRIRVVGGEQTVETVASANRSFQIEVPLKIDAVNRLFVLETFTDGQEMAPVPLQVIQDSSAPELFIDFPRDQDVVYGNTVTVAGRIGDRLTGYEGLTVKVNGIQGEVDLGIGTNGTFEVRDVPLGSVGTPTVIRALARDALGHEREATVCVSREVLKGPRLVALTDKCLEGEVGTLLPDPVAIRVMKADGRPFAGKIVNFEVTRSDGRVAAFPEDEGEAFFQTRTDAEGYAQVYWTLGSDAGCGNHRLTVSSRDIAGTLTICASAAPRPPEILKISSGDNQRGPAGGPAPEPLVVWVSDGRNPVPDTEVTFTALGGGALVNGERQTTVRTSATGHASVGLTLARRAGGTWVEAHFESGERASVIFTAVGVASEAGRPTRYSGIVLDNAGQPIQGAVCLLEAKTGEMDLVESALDGTFVFEDTQVSGPADLFVDGSVAYRVGGENGRSVPAGTYPKLHYEIVVVPSGNNAMAMPVYLPALDPANTVPFDNNQDVTLTVAGLEGFELTVRAGSMTLPDGTVPDAQNPAPLSLNLVHAEDVPMPFPDGAAPVLVATLQPSGATFDPPVEIRAPNLAGLPPGTIGRYLSFDHDTGRFEIVATTSVTDDGLFILSDPGSGIRTAGWHGTTPPVPDEGTVTACLSCEGGGQDSDLKNGSECEKCCDYGEIEFEGAGVDRELVYTNESVVFHLFASDPGGRAVWGCPPAPGIPETCNFLPPDTLEPIRYEYTIRGPEGFRLDETTAPRGPTGEIPTGPLPYPGEYFMEAFAVTNRSVCDPPPFAFPIMKVTVQAFDLDLNTHSKPWDSDGVPIVSEPGDITTADEDRELTPGGYLWVNDDNDFTGQGDTTIDLQDEPTPFDNDLERIKYEIDPSIWADDGLMVELVIDDPNGVVRLWSRNKQFQVLSGLYSYAEDLDEDADGWIWAEGLKPGTMSIEMRLIQNESVLLSRRVNLTVFAVESLEWTDNIGGSSPDAETRVEVDLTLPPAGQVRTGLRIFPDKQSLQDAKVRDEPRLVATLTPSIPLGSGWHLPLRGKIFDVDHYSNDPTFDPPSHTDGGYGQQLEGYEPRDNRTGYTGHDNDGNLTGDAYSIGISVLDLATDTVVLSQSSTTAVTWAERIGGLSGQSYSVAYLKLTEHTPCNNWRAAVGMGDSLAAAVRIRDDFQDGTTLEYVDGTRLNVGGASETASSSTRTLTVWRKVYLEEDRMNIVNLEEGLADSKSFYSAPIKSRIDEYTIEVDIPFALIDQFEYGYCHFWKFDSQGDTFLDKTLIVENTGGDAPNRIGFATPVPPDANHVFITDDDALSELTYTAPRQAVATPKIQCEFVDTAIFNDPDMLPAACIEADTEMLDEFDQVGQFVLHVETDYEVYVDAIKQAQGGPLVWTATLIGGYEGPVKYSNDPGRVSATLGTSKPFNLSNNIGIKGSIGGGFVFHETTRDVVEYELPEDFDQALRRRLRRVAMHELGHLLGSDHSDGGIMGDGATWLDEPFSGISLKKFMLLRDQGPSEPVN